MNEETLQQLRSIHLSDDYDVRRDKRIIGVTARPLSLVGKTMPSSYAYREIPVAEATLKNIHAAVNECLDELFIPKWIKSEIFLGFEKIHFPEFIAEHKKPTTGRYYKETNTDDVSFAAGVFVGSLFMLLGILILFAIIH